MATTGSGRSRRQWYRMACFALLLGCAACDIPRDPEGTLDRVQGGTLRVGIVQRAPWAYMRGDEPAGVEVELVKRFAREAGARSMEWVPGGEEELMQALMRYELDLVIGGLTLTSLYAPHAGFTSAYFTSETVVGAPAGIPPPGELRGARIAVEPPAMAATYLRKEEAVPVPVAAVADVRGLVAAPEWKLEALGFQPTTHRLYKEEHAMAAAPGENRFIVRLEHFLLTNEPLVRGLLTEEARR